MSTGRFKAVKSAAADWREPQTPQCILKSQRLIRERRRKKDLTSHQL